MVKSSTPPRITDLGKMSEAESYACMQNIIKFGNRSPVPEAKHLKHHTQSTGLQKFKDQLLDKILEEEMEDWGMNEEDEWV